MNDAALSKKAFNTSINFANHSDGALHTNSYQVEIYTVPEQTSNIDSSETVLHIIFILHSNLYKDQNKTRKARTSFAITPSSGQKQVHIFHINNTCSTCYTRRS